MEGAGGPGLEAAREFAGTRWASSVLVRFCCTWEDHDRPYGGSPSWSGLHYSDENTDGS